MNNQPLTFEAILRGELQPWRESNKLDEKFAPVLNEIATITPDFKPLFEIDFYRYFNARTRYYHKLVINEANNYCNQIISQIGSDSDLRLIKYRLSDTLKKKLPTLLRDVAKLIIARNYDLSFINPHKSTFNTDTDHKTETFIIQLLKVALVKVYLEIQEVFKSHLNDSIMELEDLYLQFLSEPIPEHTFLKPVYQIIDNEPDVVKEAQIIIPKTGKSKAKSFIYKHLTKNSDAFKDLLDSLKLNNLVDKKTSIYDLKKIFSGEENFNPVTWTGNISDLYYFIVLLHNQNKTIENVNPYHWQITCNCFIKPDGSSFEVSNLKSQKKPKQNAEMIEKVASLLN